MVDDVLQRSKAVCMDSDRSMKPGSMHYRQGSLPRFCRFSLAASHADHGSCAGNVVAMNAAESAEVGQAVAIMCGCLCLTH